MFERPSIKAIPAVTVLALSLTLAGMRTSSAYPGEEEASARNAVLQFLRDHVIGRTVESSTTFKVEEDPFEGDFLRSTTYTNLIETERGLMFDAVHVIEQTLYDLDDMGRRTSLFYTTFSYWIK